jgi:DNA-binding Lrp family transcriptional regulator
MGIIKKFTISVDWRKLGKEVEAAILITCRPRDVNKIANILKKLDEVIEIHSLSGNYDLIIMVTLKDMNEYKDFLENKLGTIPEIDRIHAGIVLEDYKEE